jgi:hypothetical protein
MELATSDLENEILEDFSIIESNIESNISVPQKNIKTVLSSLDLSKTYIQKDTIPYFKVKKISSGGQSGTEISSLKAAFELGIQTGGVCPIGTDEDLKKKYKLDPSQSKDTIEIMKNNIDDSNVIIFFLNPKVECNETTLAIDYAKSIKNDLLIIELSEETIMDVEISKIKEFLGKIDHKIFLCVSGHCESKGGFKTFSNLVYSIMYDILKPIYIPIDVVALVIESLIINTNPLLIKSMLQEFSLVSKDWYEVCKQYMEFEFKYLHFNPKSYIDLQYTGKKLVRDWTIEFWLKKGSTNNPSMSILNNPSGAFKLEQYSDTKLVGITLYGQYDEIFDIKLDKTKWNHVVFSSSKSGILTLYIDGEITGTIKPDRLENFECPLGWIGGEGTGLNGKIDFSKVGYGFVGDILEFKVWNVERTNKEIKDEMYHVYPKHKNLVLYMMFSDGKIFDYCSKNEMQFDGIEEISIKLKDFK